MASIEEKRRAHFTYIWKIDHVPGIVSIKSPMFTVESMEMTKWILVIHIDSNNYGALLSIEREEEDGGPESIEVEFDISILNIDGFSLLGESGTEDFRKKMVSEPVKFLPTSAMFDERGERFFPKDSLTVRCCIWRTGAEIRKPEMCFARTCFEVYHPSCVWAIKSFSSLQEGENRIRILNSTTKGCPTLVLFLSETEEYEGECFCIHLQIPKLKNSFHLDGEIAVLDAEGKVFHFEQYFPFTDVNNEIVEFCVLQKDDFIDALLSDDVLLLRCEMKLTSSKPAWSGIEDYKLMHYSDSDFVETENSKMHFDELSEAAVCPFKDIVNTFKEDGTLSDICLRAGSKSFPVHKLILSSRSPVFRAMFTKDMREKMSKCVDIPDLDADTLGRLLLYIYEDKIQDLTWTTAVNLFEAADKYELLDLKEKCSCFLKSNISESNVCEILILADMHHDESLKNSVQEFILNNSEIMRSDVWKAFRDNHSKLALETAEQIIFILKQSRL